MAKESLTAKVVDFTNVKDGGGSFNKRRVAAGDYLARVTKAEDAPAKGDGVHQYLFTVKLEKFNDRAFPFYCKLQENQLWKLRNLFIAAGIPVPKKRMKIDPSKVVGKLIGVTMEDDEYEGKLQSTISSVFPAAELSEDGVSDEDLPADDEDEGYDEDVQDAEVEDEAEEEEEAEEDEADVFDNMDRAQLKAYIKERNDEFRFLKSLSDDDLRAAARELISDSADEDEEEEEEEEEPPPPPKRTAKKTAKKAAAKPAVDDDELEELDISDL